MEKTPLVVLAFDLNELPLDMNEEPIDDVEPPQLDMNEEPIGDVEPPQVDINEEPIGDMVPPQVHMNEEPKDDMAPPSVDINEEPIKDMEPPQVNTNEERNVDVAPPQPFRIRLCFQKEDMEVLKQKYKVLKSSSSVEKDEYLNKLGFPGGIYTLMCIRNKKIRIPRGFSYVLGRSWLKELAMKDEVVSLPEASVEGNKEKDKGKEVEEDHLEAKKFLQEFLTKARISDVKKKGKKKDHFCPPPFHRIKKDKFFAIKRSLKPINIFGEEQYAWNPFV